MSGQPITAQDYQAASAAAGQTALPATDMPVIPQSLSREATKEVRLSIKEARTLFDQIQPAIESTPQEQFATGSEMFFRPYIWKATGSMKRGDWKIRRGSQILVKGCGELGGIWMITSVRKTWSRAGVDISFEAQCDPQGKDIPVPKIEKPANTTPVWKIEYDVDKKDMALYHKPVSK